MQIKSPKDFWAGLMFVGLGLFFALWAWKNYQMGTAVRMGPAYFPTLLGGLLATLGAVVLAESFVLKPDKGGAVQVPFNIVDMIIAIVIVAVAGFAVKKMGFASDYGVLAGVLSVSILTIIFRPKAKALILISAACVIYGYLMKPLGLVISTAALVFISAYGGHEFKWKEVGVLYVVLIIFSVLVFVKGLTLPFPLWPAALS
jgi:hypothetical protein